MKIKSAVLTMAIFTTLFGACATAATNTATEQNKNNTVKTESGAAAKTPSEAPKTQNKEAVKTENSTADKSACLTAKMDGKRLIPSQTFVFDYEPFPKSCFVTFGDKEQMLDEKDVPRGSTFHIYKDGKIIYDFEDAFDGQQACWVEGVGFEDLNGDKKIEVIIAGRCLAAKDSYPMNAVYLNINDDFRTFSSSNQLLENFKTVRQISDFVKKNNNNFFSEK